MFAEKLNHSQWRPQEFKIGEDKVLKGVGVVRAVPLPPGGLRGANFLFCDIKMVCFSEF